MRSLLDAALAKRRASDGRRPTTRASNLRDRHEPPSPASSPSSPSSHEHLIVISSVVARTAFMPTWSSSSVSSDVIIVGRVPSRLILPLCLDPPIHVFRIFLWSDSETGLLSELEERFQGSC